MSFNTALSGLQAASLDLSNTSNNIANASTTGFKYSRTEFGDVFSLSPFGNSSTAVGNGVQIDNVSQQFSQGNLEFTDASLDMAISGQGYFVVTEDRNGTNPVYSRAGEFGVDSDGFIVNNDGRFLQVFPVDTQGNITSISLNNTQSLQLPATTGAPQLTNEIEIGLNLDADKSGLNPGVFNPTQNTTYSNSTSASIFDSLGQAHVLSYYFIKDQATVNQWQVLAYLDGAPVDFTGGTPITHPNGVPPVAITQSAVQLNFDTSGEFVGSTPATIITDLTLSNGAANMQLVHDFENNSTTQYSADFSVNTLNPNGFSTGRLTGLDVNEEGLVRALYSNGVSSPLGKIALGDFRNSQGLTSVGSSSWIESSDSGDVSPGEAGSGRFGLIQSGALETSNVDLTAQLVNLITAQRNFQANARSIETLNTLTQTIIQIR